MLSNQVRPAEVLNIRAFLDNDGSDGMTLDIKSMPKIAKLAHLLKQVKQPKEGWTFSELALAFYGKPSDIRKMDKGKENNEELMQWTASYAQGTRMSSLAAHLRRKLIRKEANPNYCVKIRMPDFENEEMNILIPIEKVRQFEDAIGKLRKRALGFEGRAKQLEKLKEVSEKQRAKNTKIALEELRNTKHE